MRGFKPLVSLVWTAKPTQIIRRFSQEPPLVLPTKVFDRHDLMMSEFQDCQQMAYFSRTEQSVLELFRDYGDRMPAEVLGDLTEALLQHQVDLTQDFNLKVAPVFAAYIGKMTRDHGLHFGRVLRDFILMEIDSPMIWDALWNTYRIQKMHRYIPVEILCEAVTNACLGKMRPLEFFESALPVLSKHRHRLTEEQLDALLDGLRNIQVDPHLQSKNLLGYFNRDVPFLAKTH